MARQGEELRSISTGEKIPGWIDIENENIVAGGIASIVVREDEDGSWSIIRAVEGSEPEIDKGHASKEAAVRLAQAYNEGESIVIEERTARQIRKAGIHRGMLAKYGESPVTITGVDGNEIQVLTPEGSEFYVDHTQLSDIREAQDPGLDMVAVEPAPVEGVPGMMAGPEEEESAEEVSEMMAGPEEEESAEEGVISLEEIEQYIFEGLQVVEEELEGMEVGPPVVFVEIEPMPGQRQAPLGASKTEPKYAGLLSLLKHGGLPIASITDVQQVKLSDVLLLHKGGLPFDAYTLEGEPVPEDLQQEQLSRDGVIDALEVHYDISRDLAESLINRATRGYPTQVAYRRGVQVFAQGDEMGPGTIEYLPPEDVAPPEAGFGIRTEGVTAEGEPLFVLTQNDFQINDVPLPEREFIQELVGYLPEVADNPQRLAEQMQLAVEQGVTPIIAVIRMGNCGKCPDDMKKKKDKNAMIPIEVVAKVSPGVAEAMAANNIKGIRWARLEAILLNAQKEVTAKEAPMCPKCNKKHWPFHKCDSAGKGKEDDKKDDKEDDKEGPKDAECGPDEKKGTITRQAEEGELAAVEYAVDGTFTVDGAAGLSYEQAVDALEASAPEDNNRWRLDKYEERGGVEPELGEGAEPGRTGPSSISDAGETGQGGMSMPGEQVTGGRVRMSFDWGEFFTDVIPQLSNSQFQQNFDGVLMTPQEESTISQAEKDIHGEELLLFAREASRRDLPHPYDILHGLGDRVAVTADPKVVGEITEYRFAEGHANIDYLIKVDADNELWYSEEELTPVEGKDKKEEREKKEKKEKADKAKADKAKKEKKEKADKAKADKAKADKAKAKDKKEAAKDLQPTSNPDTTSVPWTGRSKRISDPENAKQSSDYKQDLAQKTGQTDEERVLESIAEDIVDTTVTAEQFAGWLGGQPRGADYAVLKDLAWETWGDALIAEAHRRYASAMTDDPAFGEGLKYFLGSVLSWKLPRPPDEAMKVGALAKIKAEYEPAIDEVRSLRDRSIAGTIVELNDQEAAVQFEEGVLLVDKENIEVVADFFQTAVIRKCKPGDKDPDRPAEEQEWCLYAKSTGKVLGRHPSRDKALNQEKAIKAQGARPIGGEPGTGGAPGPKRRKKLSAPPGAPSRGDIEKGRDKGNIPQGRPEVRAPSQRKYACTVFTYADQLVTKIQTGSITSSDAKKELNVTAKEQGWNAAQKKYIRQRLEGKVAIRKTSQDVLSDDYGEESGPYMESPPGEVLPEPSSILSGEELDLQNIAYQAAMEVASEAVLGLPQGISAEDAFREYSAELAELVKSKVTDPAVAEIAWGVLPELLAAELTSPVMSPEVAALRQTTANAPTNLTLRYHPEKEAYCLYDLDFGPISVDNAKEKDIKGQLQAFRLPDTQITEALKEAKQSEVLIRIGMDIGEAIAYAVDAVMAGTNTLSGTQLIAPSQAPRGILMKAAMDELTEILGEDVAASYQKPLKKALQERLEGEPRQEYDGHREFPQHGLTVPANKTARTYDESETRERVKQFAEHGIPLDLIRREPRHQPDEAPDTPPGRKLDAIASLQPFAFGDWVRDKIHPEFTGVVLGYDGDSFIRVAMDETKYCAAGSESLYLVDGLEKLAQEPEFEDIEKAKRKKRLERSPLQEDRHELFWENPEDMP